MIRAAVWSNDEPAFLTAPGYGRESDGIGRVEGRAQVSLQLW